MLNNNAIQNIDAAAEKIEKLNTRIQAEFTDWVTSCVYNERDIFDIAEETLIKAHIAACFEDTFNECFNDMGTTPEDQLKFANSLILEIQTSELSFNLLDSMYAKVTETMLGLLVPEAVHEALIDNYCF